MTDPIDVGLLRLEILMKNRRLALFEKFLSAYDRWDKDESGDVLEDLIAAREALGGMGDE